MCGAAEWLHGIWEYFVQRAVLELLKQVHDAEQAHTTHT